MKDITYCKKGYDGKCDKAKDCQRANPDDENNPYYFWFIGCDTEQEEPDYFYFMSRIVYT